MRRVAAGLTAFVLGSVALLCGLAVILVLAVALADWDRFRDEIEQLASAFLGREISIGQVTREVGWTTRVYLHDLTVANPPWADARPMLRLDEGLFAVSVLPLLRGELRFEQIRLDAPDLALQRDGEGRVNWRFRPAATHAAPTAAGEFPVIGDLAVVDGRVSYREPERELDLAGTIASATAQAPAAQPLQLVLEGRLQGVPLALELSGGPVRGLRDTASPYPLTVAVQYGDTKVEATGTALDPLQLKAMQFDLSLAGPSLSDLFPLLGIPLPATPPYSVKGRLGYKDGVWTVRDFTGNVGQSDLSGELDLDNWQRPPFLSANMQSNKLALGDLAGLIGATPASGRLTGTDRGNAQDDGIFPDVPWKAGRLHAMNMDVTFFGREVVSANLPIDRLSFRVRVHDGRAEARPVTFWIAEGKMTGEAALNSRDSPPSADADLRFVDMALKPFFQGTGFVQEMGGRFSGHAYLLGVGNSLAEVLATARGEAVVAMLEGSVSGLMVEAAGADVTEALGLVLGGDARVPIRCARADIGVEAGHADVSRLLIDTPDSLLVAKGFVDLAREYLEIQVEARAKDFSLIDINAPVRVWGPFRNLEYAIGGIDPFPFLELGGQEDLDCTRIVNEVLQSGQSGRARTATAE